MNKLTIPARNLEVEYPSAWDEIPIKHAARIGEIMYMAYMGKIDYDMARKLAVDVFINRVNSPDKPIYGEESLNYWGNESVLADSVDFLFEKGMNRQKATGRRQKGEDMGETGLKPVCTISINPKFCTQLVPRVKIGWRWYIGPKDLLSDLTIYEFKEASWRVGKFGETREEKYLDEIFAVLYKRQKAGGRRQETERRRDGERERRIKTARTLPIGIKFMIYLFFIGCMNWIREEPIEIDGQEICFGCLFPKTSSGPSNGGKKSGGDTGMAGILFQMAESGVFGNMEQTSKVSMWDVFLRLYQIHHQIKEMKK
jgi:hypothetical protein